ncbi:MAG: hypothetical protein ACJ748_16615 [Flavisolibacter sp.]
MKNSSFKLFRIVLKSFLAVTAISLLCFFVVAVKTKSLADDIWQQLGITLPDAKLNIKNSILQGSLYYYGAKNAQNIIAGNRVAVVNELVAYAKKYSSSSEFKTSYKKYRDEMKPKPYEYKAATAETIKAKERQRLEMNLKTAEEGLNSTNPKIKNGAPLRIQNIKKELAALDDPDNKTIKRLLDNENRSSGGIGKQNEDALKDFEQKYPEDPQLLIKRRLEEILNTTSDVDYTAELKETEWKGKKWLVFINPDYEKKSKEWKLAFRAGKPVTDAVRSAAENWLKEFK